MINLYHQLNEEKQRNLINNNNSLCISKIICRQTLKTLKHSTASKKFAAGYNLK